MSLLERNEPRSKPCCEAFEKVAKTFHWHTMEYDNREVYVVPTIIANDTKHRVNYCPSCGTEVRDIELDREKWNKII